jgi:hypothetical protein
METIMKVEIRELEIELIAENDHEREALARLQRYRTLRLKPDPLKTNVIFEFPDPNDWGS